MELKTLAVVNIAPTQQSLLYSYLHSVSKRKSLITTRSQGNNCRNRNFETILQSEYINMKRGTKY